MIDTNATPGATEPDTATPDAMPAGLSPGQAAWRRLRRNRLAMFGLFVVSVMVALVVFASHLTVFDPTEGHPWVNARPPGHTRPLCQSENRFRMGEVAEIPRPLRSATTLTYLVETVTARRLRIVLRRKKVKQIQEGIIDLPGINLGALGYIARELLKEDVLSQRILTQRIVVGEVPPPGLFPAGQRVMYVDLRERKKPQSYTITLQSGIVKTISVAGKTQAQKLILTGERILSVQADGKPMIYTHYLGTDGSGRDLLARILYGGQISLLVGVIATLVSLVIGVVYGAVAAYAGGRVDRVMMGIVDILYAVPFMFLVILLLMLYGRDIWVLFVALGAVQWLTMACIVRGQVLSLKEMEFVEAERMAGAKPHTIIFRHLLPHTIGTVIVYTTLTVPMVILEESFLAFIGLAVQIDGKDIDSWGALVFKGMDSLGEHGEQSWLLLWPSLAMVLTLFGLNVLGDGLRDAFDPKDG